MIGSEVRAVRSLTNASSAFGGERSAFPSGIFAQEFVDRLGQKVKIFYVYSEEIAEAHK